MARRLTHADALASWRLDGELRGGHRPSETLAFVGALMDLEDERSRQWSAPSGMILAGDYEPRWLTRLRARFGR